VSKPFGFTEPLKVTLVAPTLLSAPVVVLGALLEDVARSVNAPVSPSSPLVEDPAPAEEEEEDALIGGVVVVVVDEVPLDEVVELDEVAELDVGQPSDLSDASSLLAVARVDSSVASCCSSAVRLDWDPIRLASFVSLVADEPPCSAVA
jgi:hypothetical protein